MSCEHCSEKKTIRKEEDKKKLISRINRLKGQMDGIRKMIEDDRYCGDVLIQLAAISSSVKSLSSVIFELKFVAPFLLFISLLFSLF